MLLGLVRSSWSGTSGGPGVSQFYFRTEPEQGSPTVEAATAVHTAVRTFWQEVAPFLPDEISISVSPTIDIYNDVSGELVNSISANANTFVVVGTSTAVFSMASGMKINLQTGFVRNGRRVRGGIFIVPAGSNSLSTSGLVAATARTAVAAATNKMLAAFRTAGVAMVVFSRPIPAGEKYGPRVGASAPITGSEVSEKVAVLRGRRD